ncbi:hypothetical protein HPB47_020502 [Ixodes persulcatus]|uniref:Uncharacterized protein n=1 Tax=Ixodes persulcatus TaxID=34615 RepID=A0AC60QFH8_IXOPE|nr:hypothetical protein HPB47_020502 [Ixodes persulcatus]
MLILDANAAGSQTARVRRKRFLDPKSSRAGVIRGVPIPVVIATSRPARISPRSSLTAFPSLETFLQQDYSTRQSDGGVPGGTGHERVHSTRALETAL